VGAVKHVKKNKSRLHVMGLMGDEDSPHSDPEHFRAILKLAKKNNIEEVYCHLFTDGRDSYPRSAKKHLKHFRHIMAKEGIGKIATICGRFYAMDRVKNWKRLTLAYDAIVFSNCNKVQSAEEAIDDSYADGLTDEYVFPSVIMENGKPVAQIKDNDSVIFFNLRSDRARQFTKLFEANNKERIIKDDMPVIDHKKNLYFVAMTDFGPDLDIHTAYAGRIIDATLPMVLRDLRQLYIAESEKFAHVTYFFNGGYADPVNGEERIMIKSPGVDSYANAPEMSAELITQKILDGVRKNKYDFITMNFANADMVGHTGDFGATVKAVEFLDKQLKILTNEIVKKNGTIMITADHGNADDMVDFDTNQPNTFHTKNPVPFILIGEKFKNKKLFDGGVLGNVAPTVLDILGVEKPLAMKKKSLLEKA
jgi:2,3-bisphosphoglycerate-independent phosphoglycerate mutase